MSRIATLGGRGRLALLAAALVAAVVVVSGGSESTVDWAMVETRDLHRDVPFTGSLLAGRVDHYGPPNVHRFWNFKISYLAAEGTRVEAGETVVSFDVSELEARLRKRQSERDAARKRLQERRVAFDVRRREQALALEEAEAVASEAEIAADLPADVVARRELEKADIDLALAEDEVDHRRRQLEFLDERAVAELEGVQERLLRTEAEIESIRASIESMTVRAVAAGTVMHRQNHRGEKKKLGDAAWRGEVIVEVPSLDRMLVDAWFEEDVAGEVASSQSGEIYLESQQAASFRVRVLTVQQTVEPLSRRDPQRVVRAELELVESDRSLVRPGMRVQGRIRVESRPDRLVMPVDAVRLGPDGRPAADVRSLLGRRRQVVELGTAVGALVEVASGLEPGDLVAVRR